MSPEEKITQAKWQPPAEKIDWPALLSAEDFHNLAGFFDVLIEMDFEQKNKGEHHDIQE